MKWLAILFIFPISSFACELELRANKQVYKVCQKGDYIFSKECELAGECFKTPTSLNHSSSQSPLFSLCYQSNGKPRFAKLQGKKNKIEVCINSDSKIVDLNSLMRYFKEQAK